MRLAEDRFYVVTGSQFGVRDCRLDRRHSAERRLGGDPRGHLRLCGSQHRRPARRAKSCRRRPTTISPTPPSPISPCARSRSGSRRGVRAARVGYVGELGWELHVPTEYAAHVYERLMEAGADHGLIDAGYRAIESLRLEKGYVYWSADVTPDTNPYEAGLGFAVALDKGDFIGRDGACDDQGRGPGAQARDADRRRLRAADRRRDDSRRRRGGRHDDQRRLRLHGREDDRLRLSAGRRCRRTPRLRSRPTASATPATRGPRSLYDPKGERLRS